MLVTPVVKIESRPGTQDEGVFRDVIAGNCYHLPDYFKSTDTIIDGGAHIGCFTIACAFRGAGRIYAYEPGPSNFALLEKNTATTLGVRAINKALWRSDRKEQVYFSGYPGPSNACGTVLPGVTVGGRNVQYPVDSISLDDAIEEAGDVRLLKLDIEGAEYLVLGTCTKLDAVEEIAMEVHEYPEGGKGDYFSSPTARGVEEFLRGKGFKEVEIEDEKFYESPNLKLLFARR